MNVNQRNIGMLGKVKRHFYPDYVFEEDMAKLCHALGYSVYKPKLRSIAAEPYRNYYCGEVPRALLRNGLIFVQEHSSDMFPDSLWRATDKGIKLAQGYLLVLRSKRPEYLEEFNERWRKLKWNICVLHVSNGLYESNGVLPDTDREVIIRGHGFVCTRGRFVWNQAPSSITIGLGSWRFADLKPARSVIAWRELEPEEHLRTGDPVCGCTYCASARGPHLRHPRQPEGYKKGDYKKGADHVGQ